MFQEHLDNSVKRGLGHAGVGVSDGDHLGKVDGGRRVLRHDSSEDLHEVGLVAGLLAVGKDLVKLVGLNQTLEYLVGGTSTLENLQGKLGVVLAH